MSDLGSTESIGGETEDMGGEEVEGMEEMEEMEESSDSEVEADEDEPMSYEAWEAKQEQLKNNDKQALEENADKEEAKAEDKEESKENEQSHYTIKVDGEEISVPKERVPEMLQKGLAADVRMREAAKIRTEAREFVGLLKSKPEEAFKMAGLDFSELAENFIYEKLQYQQMNPDQRDAFDNKKMLATREQELQRYRETEERQKQAQAEAQKRQESQQSQQKYVQSYSKQIPHALKLAGIEHNEANFRSMVVEMMAGVKRDPNFSAYDAIDSLKSKIGDEQNAARQSRVSKFKESSKAPQSYKGSKKRGSKNPRFSSIYDILE